MPCVDRRFADRLSVPVRDRSRRPQPNSHDLMLLHESRLVRLRDDADQKSAIPSLRFLYIQQKVAGRIFTSPSPGHGTAASAARRRTAAAWNFSQVFRSSIFCIITRGSMAATQEKRSSRWTQIAADLQLRSIRVHPRLRRSSVPDVRGIPESRSPAPSRCRESSAVPRRSCCHRAARAGPFHPGRGTRCRECRIFVHPCAI